VSQPRIEQVDERNSSWEDNHPRFRVYLHHTGDDPSLPGWSTDTYDITDADILQVIDWRSDRPRVPCLLDRPGQRRRRSRAVQSESRSWSDLARRDGRQRRAVQRRRTRQQTMNADASAQARSPRSHRSADGLRPVAGPTGTAPCCSFTHSKASPSRSPLEWFLCHRAQCPGYPEHGG